MRAAEIFRFELAYQARRPWLWLIGAALVWFAFQMTRDGTLAEALMDDFFVNSPFAIAKTTVVGNLLWLLTAAAVAGEAAARDVATGMHPLTYTAPIGKAEYLGGRFLAALALNALILLAVQAGILLGVYVPGVEAGLIGPFRPAGWLTAYAFLALPSAFAATAVQFWFAAWSRRPAAAYLGSLVLFALAYVVGFFLFVQGRQDLARLLDPIGVHFILSDLSHLWTSAEKSARLVTLEGTVLANRLLWLGVGAGALGATWARFRFAHESGRLGWRLRGRHRETHAPPRAAGTGRAPIAVPQVARAFGFGAQARQALAIAGESFRAIATGWAGRALLLGVPLLTVLVVLDQMVFSGVPVRPWTALVLSELTAPLAAEISRWVFVPLLVAFFAGELVWRERDAGTSEITDAMPGSEWAPFLGKLLGLSLVLATFMVGLAVAGALAQAIRGYEDFEAGLYMRVLLGLQLPEYLLFAVLALAVHVAVDQKYIGHLVAVLAYVFIAMPTVLGVEHNLLVYGAGPAWSYTEMRGFGASLGPWAWFKLYWAGWAVLLAVAGRLLWVRGKEAGREVRLRSVRGRLTRPTVLVGAAAAGLVLFTGGFIFYNTNVLNEHLTASDRAERSAAYERRYGRFASAPQPRLTAAALHVEIHPERRAAHVRGTYHLVNRSAQPIDSVHVATAADAETGEVTFDRPATRVLVDAALGHRIYALDEPLQPGAALALRFEVRVGPRGFRDRSADPPVVDNGTAFTNSLLPAIGYQEHRELTSPSARRERGLPARPQFPSLYDAEARGEPSEGVAFSAVVGTREDQVAVAPGALQRSWTERGRRYFHYVTDAPIGGEWPFFSARYAVRAFRWQRPGEPGQAIAIRLHHHPGHTEALDRMERSIRASLDYYSEAFGPYPYGHLAVVERPGNGMGMHADASVISYSEGAAAWSPKRGPQALDLPFAVMAHEMAHQWTVPYAYVEGASVMSESLAWYYGMKAVEAASGREQLHRLLSFMRRPYPYPPIRRGEPLLRGVDPYLAYRKGPFALYALSEYAGTERVNAALRRLLETHRAPGALPATTLDLYRQLEAATPDSLRYLLHDLFEVNTFWELRTERATAEPAGGGAWRVKLDVRARKVVADSAGVETEVPMDEWVEVGVFARAEQGGELSAPLYLQKHRVRSGEQTITVTVPRKPELAGIDPHHVLDWEERGDDDNTEPVQLER